MHFITYRLAGTIPCHVLARLRELRTLRLRRKLATGETSARRRERVHKQFFTEYDHYLDRDASIDWLARPPVAALVRGNLFHHAGDRYQLLAYCVMPNHVHVLLQPTELVAASGPRAAPATSDPDEREDSASPLAKIMHALKSYTAHQANRLLGRTGQFWQHESYDHWVRDGDELARIVAYIAWNPVRAKLVREPHEWYFSSAHDRFLRDGSRAGYLL
jgi:putative DNA methylase